MDLDLANVRAFVEAATELHFGRAAQTLFLSQQGLSKRISRLESGLGVTLFHRRAGVVSLTEAGQRFMPHARQLLEIADAGVAASRPEAAPPLRVDVWGEVQMPLRLVREILRETEKLQVTVSMRRGLPAAVDALRRGEIDAAFGNVHHLTEPLPSEVEHVGVGYEPVHMAVPVAHPLAELPELRHTDLARHQLWWPLADGAAEVAAFILDFARDHRIPVDTHGPTACAELLVDALAERGDRVVIYGAWWPPPPDPRVRIVPLVDPHLYYPWSLLWRRDNTHPQLPELIAQAVARAPGTDQGRDVRAAGHPQGNGASGVWTGVGVAP